MTNAPLWLQVCLAIVPILAAVVAGIFAVTNTVNSRVERLKCLTEIYAKYPKELNLDNALEIVMLRELKAIEFAVTPTHKWDKRVHWIWALGTGFGYAVVFSSLFVDLPPVLTVVGTALFGIGGVTLLIGVVWLNVHVEPLRAHNRYDRKIKELRGD